MSAYHALGHGHRAPDAGTARTVTIKPSQGQENLRCRYCEETMWRLWIVPVDGSDPVPTELVYEPANAGAIAFDIHPDGKRIVYTTGAGFNQYWAVRNLGLD